MKLTLSWILIYLISLPVFAIDKWQFSKKIAVTGEVKPGVFHHLDGAGRKHIATSDNEIAVVWEDDHSADPQIYLSVKLFKEQKFSTPIQLSKGQEAYEPAITGLSNNRFVIAWEQDGAVVVSSLLPQQKTNMIELSKSGSHVSVSAYGGDVYLVWREQNKRNWSVWVARLKVAENGQLSIQTKNKVESKALSHPVMYPTIAVNNVGQYVAWEDREDGHTRLKFSLSIDKANTFFAPQYLNEFYSKRNEYDKGNGVTRVSMAAISEDEVVAAWMDKRRSAGYGIYAAMSSDESFGPNEKVHSQKGDELPHYNPATAGNAEGEFVLVWDDYRTGSSDIWLSSYDENNEWSEDYSPTPASGKSEQTKASVSIDEQGNLHLLWVERDTTIAPTRLWYSYGVALSYPIIMKD